MRKPGWFYGGKLVVFGIATAGCCLLGAACGGDDDDTVDAAPQFDAEVLPMVTGTLSGVVTAPALEGDADLPVQGVTLSLLGVGAPYTTTTSAAGEFSLELPVGTREVLLEKEGHWSQIVTFAITEAGIADAELWVAPDPFVAEIDDMLTDNFDPAKGVLFVDFVTESDAGGESAYISAGSDGSFVFGSSGAVDGTEVLPNGESFVSFYGVTVGTTTVTVTGSAGVTTCAAEFPGRAWPVRAKTFTEVTAACTP